VRAHRLVPRPGVPRCRQRGAGEALPGVEVQGRAWARTLGLSAAWLLNLLGNQSRLDRKEQVSDEVNDLLNPLTVLIDLGVGYANILPMSDLVAQ
jgi:hypothetical protein